MNDLIKIETREISGATIQTVNARDLHAFLESKQDFSTWIKSRIEQYGFVEGQDFTVHKFVDGRATVIDYFPSLDMAKEISMVERNEKGKQARQYFIACERRAKEPVAPQMLIPQTLPEALRLAAEAIEQRDMLAIENKAKSEALAIAAPKAEALDRMTLADGEVCLQTAGKLLQQHPNKFIAWLRSLGTWIFKRPGSSRNSAYTDKINAGYLNVRATTTIMPDGSERVTEQVVVTPKGLTKLAQMLGVETSGNLFGA